MRLLTVDDAELAFDAQGMDWPQVSMHGVGSDRRSWRPQVDAFASHYLTVAVDFRGHGESRASAGTISLAGFAADVAALIDALGAGPARLCGLSMGAIVALQLWAARPAAVLSLVLADAWAYHKKAQGGLPERVAAIDATSMAELARARMRAVVAPHASRELVERSIAVMAGKDRHCYRRSNEVLWGADIRAVARTVTVPTLVLVGELDRVTPPQLSAELPSLIPLARLAVIPGAGHLSNEENPDAFNTEVCRFLGTTVEASNG